MATGDQFCPDCEMLWPCKCTDRDGLARPQFVPFIQPAVKTREGLKDFLGEYLGDEIFADQFAECISVMKKKHSDYAGSDDRCKHFRECADEIGVSMEKVWAVFFRKHLSAIMRYVKDGSVESEPIESRITDAINYLILLRGIIVDKR